jgi:hypothetical protein
MLLIGYFDRRAGDPSLPIIFERYAQALIEGEMEHALLLIPGYISGFSMYKREREQSNKAQYGKDTLSGEKGHSFQSCPPQKYFIHTTMPLNTASRNLSHFHIPI